MGNPWAGEVTLVIDGAPRIMKLTLGSLAELEAELKTASLVALVERFETGEFSSGDVVALLVAGLRGGGDLSATAADVAHVEIEGGPMGAARAAAELLARAFVVPDSNRG
ncbi:MAG: gene transfer agent family protein [Rhodobacteraceae bacterium]|nr:gene transfer agent family protein [Paracoccaceae bacterium]